MFSLDAIGKKIKTLALGEECVVDEAMQERAKKLAEELRDLARSSVEDAWKKLGDEFKVQKLVWDSKGISKKGKGAEEQALEDKLQAVLQETMDPIGALSRIEDILKIQNGRVSTSMLQTLQSIPRQTGLIDKRKALADRLAASTNPATLSQTQAEKDSLEKLVVMCRLAKALDRRVREALELPPPRERSASKENKKDINVDSGMKPLVIVTPSRNLYECVGFEKVGPKASSKSIGSVGAAVGAKQTYSNLSMQSTKSPHHAGDLQLWSAEVATKKLQSMASEGPSASWNSLRSEFETQLLVWQSVAGTRKKDPVIVNKIASLKASFERILALHSDSNERALEALSELLRRTEDLKILNKSIVTACRDVIRQHELPPQRLKLAERVNVSSVPATLPKTNADKRELETLVLACDLDTQLTYSVRKLLLLPIPEELQALVAESTSLMTAVLRRRSSMRTSSRQASRRDSNVSVGPTERVSRKEIAALGNACEESGLGSVSAGARVIEQI